jgi:hypothetical protein
MKIKNWYKKIISKGISICTLSLMFPSLSLLLTCCIDPFNPDVSEPINLLTVDGSIIKGRETQSIIIKKSIAINDTGFIEVENCQVKVVDDQSNEFLFEEGEEGEYTSEIDDERLVINRSYRLIIETPEGERYESTPEIMHESPPIDTVYYHIEEDYSLNSNEEFSGLRFYIDLKAKEEGSRYFRWIIDETWELRMPLIAEYAIIGDSTYIMPPHFDPVWGYVQQRLVADPIIIKIDEPIHICWKNLVFKGMFLENTLNLSKNEKEKIPLHFVRGKSEKLRVKYSINVQQYALSEGAFNYWQQKKVELQESGGLYTTQPAQTMSNIVNVNNPDETILGYFWTSTKSEKRIYYDGPFENKIFYDCPPDTISISPFTFPWGPSYPIYYYILPGSFNLLQITSLARCFDCRMHGGTLEKPEFWDN